MFLSQTYSQRRSQLVQNERLQMQKGIIVLLGNEESPMNYADNTYHFRQDSNFLYYIGLDLPSLAATIDLDTHETTLYGQDIGIDHIIWMGNQPSLRELAAQSGITKTASPETLTTVLKKAQEKGRTVHYLPPYRAKNMLKMSALLGQTVEAIKVGQSVDLVKAVIAQREVKSAEELAEMDKAVNITRLMHLAVQQQKRVGILEAELAGLAEGIAASKGAGLAYPVILTVNGQILHNHYHGNTLQSGQMILIDAGASALSHYAGDITRTFPVDEKFTSKQQDIYDIVLETERKAIESLRPGITYQSVHLAAAKNIATGLKALGLLKGNVDEAVAAGAHALFFPHGLGHQIGLDVHDMEDLGENLVGYDATTKRSEQFGTAYLRLGKTLQTGYTLTVEPGIYFIPQLMDKWRGEGKYTDFINYDKLDAYRDFGGIRIEDNCVITETGYRVLGNPIPK